MVKATVDFSRFIGISSLGVEFWWTSPSRDWNATARRRATAVTIGSVYELEYVATLTSDLITAKFS